MGWSLLPPPEYPSSYLPQKWCVYMAGAILQSLLLSLKGQQARLPKLIPRRLPDREGAMGAGEQSFLP